MHCACTLPDRVEAWLTCFDVSHHDINQAYLGYYVWLGMSSRFTGVAMVDPSHYWPQLVTRSTRFDGNT